MGEMVVECRVGDGAWDGGNVSEAQMNRGLDDSPQRDRTEDEGRLGRYGSRQLLNLSLDHMAAKSIQLG